MLFLFSRGQSLSEVAKFAEFAIELSLKSNEVESLLEKHGVTSPRIPTWFCSIQSRNGGNIKIGLWKGPAEDLEVAKAFIEEFYEGCTWRYARIKLPSQSKS